MVLNTESAKIKSANDGSDIDVPFTEERLGDELLHLKVNSCFNCSEGFYHTKLLLHCCPQHSGMYRPFHKM